MRRLADGGCYDLNGAPEIPRGIPDVVGFYDGSYLGDWRDSLKK